MIAYYLAMILTSGGPPSTPLRGKTINQLLACAGDASRCHAGDVDLAKELASREPPEVLLQLQRSTRGPAQRVVLLALARLPPTPAINSIFSARLPSADDDLRYELLNYLLGQCNKDALVFMAKWSKDPFAPCLGWAELIKRVGECKYQPAGRLLIDSLSGACLNVVVAGDEALRQIVPNAPAAFSSRDEEAAYFRRQLGVPPNEEHLRR